MPGLKPLLREQHDGPDDVNSRAGQSVQQQHKVVIVGGGAGGLELASSLGRKLGKKNRASITLIDCSRRHVWKPLLHQVAAGSFDPDIHAVDYLAQAQRCHFDFRMGTLEGLDRAAKKVWLSPTLNEQGEEIIPRRSFSYDTLVLAIGSISHDFAIPGVQEHCWFLDTQKEAVNFQKRLLEKLIQATTRSDMPSQGQLDIAIVGAGATGVELAAQLHQVTRRLRQYGFEHLDPERHMRIKVIDAGPRILPALPERLSDQVQEELAQLGIEALTGQNVTRVTAGGVETADGGMIPAAITVWAAGIKAPEVLGKLDLETNSINQVVVGPDMRSVSDADIFALGDCAAFPVDDQGRRVPPRAQAAHQQASFIARRISNRVRGGSSQAKYRYRDYGSLVTLGRYSTVGSLMGTLAGNVWISGLIARLVYLSLHKMHQVSLHGSLGTLMLTLSALLRRSVNPEVKLH